MEKPNEPAAEDRTQNTMGQINRALGLFICFFGAIVLASVFFTETRVGQMTNLVAGLILAAVGIIMIVRSKPRSGAVGMLRPDDPSRPC
ncbi:MAG: hypothetical protein ACYSWO_06470 [Planctomycetota bacterium]|jgi:uncharacterized membrane protein HdeD (DUF308 family)